jgi:hypothetical protein
VHRVFDFAPAEQEVIVSRILVQVHQAVDEAFPHARPASQRFAKTAFVGYDEPTLTQLVPSEAIKEALAAEQGLDALDSRTPKPRLLADISEEEPISQENELEGRSWDRFRDNMSVKQTLIGILTLILVALLAYLWFAE